MPRKCLNHPDTFRDVCGEMTFKYQRRNFTPLIKKCYDVYAGRKAGNQDKIWVHHICYVTCAAFHRMGKWFASNAFHHSHVLEGTKRPLIRLLLLFNKHNREHLQIQTHSKVSSSATCKEACLTQ
jgi:hypothetical protein